MVSVGGLALALRGRLWRLCTLELRQLLVPVSVWRRSERRESLQGTSLSARLLGWGGCQPRVCGDAPDTEGILSLAVWCPAAMGFVFGEGWRGGGPQHLGT